MTPDDFKYRTPNENGLLDTITITSGCVYHAPVDACRHCHREWIGKRRLLGHGIRNVCELCDRREREGLVRYRPSNGTEAMLFEDRCHACRHYSVHPNGYGVCGWKVLDRMSRSAWEDLESEASWYDPDDIDASTCPATCKRFTHRDDNDGDYRDPPPIHDPSQMTFEDLLEVAEPQAMAEVSL